MRTLEYLSDEAARCLKCKKPKCQSHCPINTPIPEAISLFQSGNIHQAGELLFQNNPLFAITGIVCPHENQCKGYCIRGIKGEPVSFCEIERYIGAEYLKDCNIKKAPDNHHKIAIIGSGPAGITGALRLAQKGYQVTVFEARDCIGGVLTYGIPEFRLPRTLIADIERIMNHMNIRIKPNTLVGPVITVDKLLSDGYDAVFIATGVWNPKTLNIPGETLGHSFYAIDYLKNPSVYRLGKRVIVIGAGNVAMDAARSAKYYGAEHVQICYRRGLEDMTATKAEIEEAKKEEIEFSLYKSPIRITDEGVVFASTEKVTQPDGSKVLQIIPDSEQLIPCDNVIIAVSQTPQANIVTGSPDLQTRYRLLVTDELGHTTKQGVFACGDVVSGARTVIEAVAASKKVADSMDEYCNSK